MKISGIYIVKNIINGKRYVGSAINIQKRFCEHQHDLIHNNHDNDYLQKAWNKYGKDNFEFSILEKIKNPSLLIEREQHYLDSLQTFDDRYGYNIRKHAESNLGLHHSKETIEKIRKALKGKNPNKGKPNPFYGKKHSEESLNSMRKLRSKEGRLAIKIASQKRSIKAQVKLICKNCNKIFYRIHCKVPKSDCCSIKCFNQFKVPKQIKICLNCKTTFILTHFSDRGGKFCSHECYLQTKRLKPISSIGLNQF